jgi:hypothetical protein
MTGREPDGADLPEGTSRVLALDAMLNYAAEFGCGSLYLDAILHRLMQDADGE